MNDYPQTVLGLTIAELRSAPFIVNLGDAPRISEFDDEWYVEFPGAGVSCVVGPSGLVFAVQLYGCGKDGYSDYGGPLPDGLKITAVRAEARALFGRPVSSSDGGHVALLGPMPGWDRYERDGFSVHLSFGGLNGAIDLVTLSRDSYRWED